MTNVAPQPVPSSAPEAPLDLRHPALYVNRELSWLEFNRRVLHEALDPRTPLLERLKFLGIYSSNLDEFFQVRVAGLKRQVKAAFTERTADGLTAEEQLSRISTTVLEQLSQHRHALVTDVLPSMADQGVRLVTRLSELSAADRRHVDHFFQANVFPVLTPLAVDPGHPFPYISNLSLSIAVALRDADGEERFARVKVPKILPRWVPCLTPNTFVALEQVVGGNLEALFPGVEILGWYLFRITRNTDIVIDDSDEADDLLDLIQEEVRNRRFAEVVRLEVHYSMPLSLRQLLLAEFNEEQQDVAPPLTTSDIYEVQGLFDTADLLNRRSRSTCPTSRTRCSTPRRRTAWRRGAASSRCCARATCCCTTRTTASPPRSSASCRRRPTTRTSWRSSSRSTARAATRASRRRSCRRPSVASRWRC